jgi:hypothetical protein
MFLWIRRGVLGGYIAEQFWSSVESGLGLALLGDVRDAVRLSESG